jgi:hypothetical protein
MSSFYSSGCLDFNTRDELANSCFKVGPYGLSAKRANLDLAIDRPLVHPRNPDNCQLLHSWTHRGISEYGTFGSEHELTFQFSVTVTKVRFVQYQAAKRCKEAIGNIGSLSMILPSRELPLLVTTFSYPPLSLIWSALHNLIAFSEWRVSYC